MALIIVSGGKAARPTAPSAGMSAAVRDKLGDILPPAARVLAIGCRDDMLRTRYLARHPQASWHSVEHAALAPTQERFDLLLIGEALHRLPDPAALLDSLHLLCEPEGRLLAWTRNAVQPELFERLAESDLSGENDEAVHRHSAASIFKLLMDCGWMPALAAECAALAPRPATLAAAAQLAQALGVPQTTALSQLRREHLIIDARPTFRAAAPPPAGEAARFTVVVPTTRETQLRLNVERSPGLAEVGARIVSYRGALDPAEALERSLPHCDSDWVLFCHQDVYFPRGFGAQLNALLHRVPSAERKRALFGFAGIGMNQRSDDFEPAGFVIDRTSRFDHAASEQAVSIDELAIVLSRHSLHRIDPKLGWHLWATDLCLAAMTQHDCFAHILRLPLFHNSTNDYQLPTAFHDSAARLARKHAGLGVIRTLCGSIEAPVLQTAA